MNIGICTTPYEWRHSGLDSCSGQPTLQLDPCDYSPLPKPKKPSKPLRIRTAQMIQSHHHQTSPLVQQKPKQSFVVFDPLKHIEATTAIQKFRARPLSGKILARGKRCSSAVRRPQSRQSSSNYLQMCVLEETGTKQCNKDLLEEEDEKQSFLEINREIAMQVQVIPKSPKAEIALAPPSNKV